jgi:hypothetical protein
MIKIKEITKTCGACPAQWEGTTIENEPVYIRYRWGYLSIRIGPKNGDIQDAVEGKEIFGKQVDESGWAGEMLYSQLKKHTKSLIKFSQKETE